MRFFIGWVIALILLAMILPHVGVPQERFMPPSRVYSLAQGKANGNIVNKYTKETTDPFHPGDRVNYVDYEFKVVPPAPPVIGFGAESDAKTKANKKSDNPTKAKDYISLESTVVVGNKLYDNAEKGKSVPVRYEKTFPEINGIDDEEGGQACVGPNLWYSWHWLRWVGLSLVLGYVIMLLIDRFAVKQDI
jgi:hypothetical protein